MMRKVRSERLMGNDEDYEVGKDDDISEDGQADDQ